MLTIEQTDIFTTGATHMAHIHNAILRGYNSIYQQAAHVKEEDKAAFVGYALAWYRFVKSHHDDEEAELFPKVEEVLGTKGVWDETHAEHGKLISLSFSLPFFRHQNPIPPASLLAPIRPPNKAPPESFLPGLASLETYLVNLATPSAFSGLDLLAIMSSFRAPFAHHFHHEIATITSLSSLPAAPAHDSPEADAAAAVFKAWGKKTVMKAGAADGVPFFLLNLDATYEEGRWASWPPMPAPVRWGLVNVAGAVHWGWWKFASCDAWGRPRELYALGDGGIVG
jgi:hypothetical protein